MANYEVTGKGFIDGKICEPGDIITTKSGLKSSWLNELKPSAPEAEDDAKKESRHSNGLEVGHKKPQSPRKPKKPKKGVGEVTSGVVE